MRKKRKYYSLVREPKGDLYTYLLEAAGVYANYAQVVIRHTLSLSEKGRLALRKLQPFLHSQEEAAEWPGTKLIGSTATIYRYYIEPSCIETLTESSNALYEWKQPELPEDLCFLRADGSPWFGSISHEADSFFILSVDEYYTLTNHFPILTKIIKEDQTSEE